MRITKSVVGFCFVLSLGLFLGGCEREISPSTYVDSAVGEVSQTFECTVIKVRQVNVQGSEKLQDNTIGLVGGGAAGALAGSVIGKGHGRTLAQVAGALAGATAGAYAQKQLSKQKGLEYVVRLDSGELRTIVQGVQSPLAIGQRALLIISGKRSRLVSAS